jgi:RNA polymerase sigma-70 factor (ECF subfamily)
MKNTPYKSLFDPSKHTQLQRIRRAIEEVLSPPQREILLAYYIHGKNIPQIAEERGIHKSSVSRTLKRAEENLRRYLKY